MTHEGFEAKLVCFCDYKIEPCNHCNYECFSERIRGTQESCPINDDLPKIYQEFENSDIVIFGIPTYVGHVPSLFRIFEERTLGIYGFGRHMNMLEGKTYGFIVPEQLLHSRRSHAQILWLQFSNNVDITEV